MAIDPRHWKKSAANGGVHGVLAATYANAAARVAAVGFDGELSFTADDIGKLVRQTDNESLWELITTGPTWTQVLTAGGGLPLHATTHKHGGTDEVATATPAANAIPKANAGSTFNAGWIDDTAHGARGGGTQHAVATTSVAGFMSATDKTLLDSLMQGNVTTLVRNETGATLLKGRLVSVFGYSVVHSRPTVRLADKDDSAKRPAIAILLADLPDATNADALVVGTIIGVDTSAFAETDQLVLGNSGAFVRPPPGNSPFTGEVQNIGSVSRVHATLGEIVVSLDGLDVINADQVFALAGTSGTPSPTNKYVTDSDARNTNARTPTAHAASHVPGGTDPLATAAAGTIAVGDAAAVGTAASFARSDHVHALPAPTAPADVTKAAASAGAATTVARADHKHDVSTAAPGTVTFGAASEGTATSLARSDHAHALTAPAAPADVTKAAASAGASANVAREDHKHDVSTGTPVAVGVANAAGTATSLVRSDHVHAANGALLVWGSGSVAATTTTRYLQPYYTEGTAPTAPVQFRVPFPGSLRSMRIHANTTAGNGNAIVYTARINSVASTLTVSLASTSADGSDLTHFPTVAAGDLVDIEVTKAASVATSPSDILASLELAQV